MLLSEWLDQRGRGARKRMAAALGVSPQHVTGMCDGSTRPSLPVAVEIERYTSGEVSIPDLLRPGATV